ncbi:hypothetical protein Tco_1195538 [Tanacetum coccineum]
MIQPEPEDLPKDNPKLEKEVLRNEDEEIISTESLVVEDGYVDRRKGSLIQIIQKKSTFSGKALYGLKKDKSCHKVVRLGINPMIQPEPEDLPKDNPKLEKEVLRNEDEEIISTESLVVEGAMSGMLISTSFYL